MVNISGWWFQPTPLKNDGVCQWEGLLIPYMKWKIKFMFQTTDQDRFIVRKNSALKLGLPLHCPYVCHWNHWDRRDNLQSSGQILSKRFTAWLRTSTWRRLPPFTHRRHDWLVKGCQRMLTTWRIQQEKGGAFNSETGDMKQEIDGIELEAGDRKPTKTWSITVGPCGSSSLTCQENGWWTCATEILTSLKSSKFLQDVNSQQLPAGSRVPSSLGSWSQSAPQHHATQWLHLMVNVVLFRIHMANLGNSLQKNNKLSSAYTFLYKAHNGTYTYAEYMI